MSVIYMVFQDPVVPGRAWPGWHLFWFWFWLLDDSPWNQLKTA